MMPGRSHGLVILRLGLPLGRHLLRRLERSIPPTEANALDQRDQALIDAYCGLSIALGEEGPESAMVYGDEVILTLVEPVARHLRGALEMWSHDDPACGLVLAELDHWLGGAQG
jgi:hypothetical protein